MEKIDSSMDHPEDKARETINIDDAEISVTKDTLFDGEILRRYDFNDHSGRLFSVYKTTHPGDRIEYAFVFWTNDAIDEEVYSHIVKVLRNRYHVDLNPFSTDEYYYSGGMINGMPLELYYTLDMCLYKIINRRYSPASEAFFDDFAVKLAWDAYKFFLHLKQRNHQTISWPE